MNELSELWRRLCYGCHAYPSLMIAFSGGVDSSLLALAAKGSVAGPLRLVFCRSPLNTAAEEEQARRLAESFGLPFRVTEPPLLSLEEVAQNRRQRCYACKHALLSHLWQLAKEEGIAMVAEGSNADDLRAGNRPGSRACAELGVAQPLAAAGLSKEQVRTLARLKGLPNHEQAARPCLATRFPYDTLLTVDKLAAVAAGEELLRGLGLKDFRLRSQGDICRIEAKAEDWPFVILHRPRLIEELKALGWRFITIDLEGLTSGGFDRP